MNIMTISKYTFYELLKSRVLYSVFFLGLGLLFVSFTAAEFTYGVPEKVAIDFGLGMLSLSAVGIALFMGANLISKEMENRTVHMIIARPISRASFVIGKSLGMILLLTLNVLILGVLTVAAYFFLGGEYDSLIVWSIVYSLLEAVIILNVVILFSMITTTTMAVIYSILVFSLGHFLTSSLDLSMVANRPWLDKIIKIYSVFFPDFSKLNIKQYILYSHELSNSYLLKGLVYGVCYSLIVLVISAFLFSRKNLD